MKLPKLILLITFIITTSYAKGQSNKVSIEYTENSTLTINEFSLENATSIAQLVQVLGEPSKIADYPRGEQAYFYDDLGIMFATMDKQIKAMGINFNWDGDKKFPEKSYVGVLTMVGTKITKDSSIDTIASIANDSFICPIPILCASKDKEAPINCTVAFKDGKITQVVFLIK